MQKYVFFGMEPQQKAPELFGVLTTCPELKWVGLDHVLAALDSGDEVNIRQASGGERARTDAALALFEVGKLISAKLDGLLDQPDSAPPNAPSDEAPA